MKFCLNRKAKKLAGYTKGKGKETCLMLFLACCFRAMPGDHSAKALQSGIGYLFHTKSYLFHTATVEMLHPFTILIIEHFLPTFRASSTLKYSVVDSPASCVRSRFA